MVIVNGIEENLAGRVLLEYLSAAGFDLRRTAVEINGDIIPKSTYASTVLSDGDVVEVVNFVGGG